MVRSSTALKLKYFFIFFITSLLVILAVEQAVCALSTIKYDSVDVRGGTTIYYITGNFVINDIESFRGSHVHITRNGSAYTITLKLANNTDLVVFLLRDGKTYLKTPNGTIPVGKGGAPLFVPGPKYLGPLCEWKYRGIEYLGYKVKKVEIIGSYTYVRHETFYSMKNNTVIRKNITYSPEGGGVDIYLEHFAKARFRNDQFGLDAMSGSYLRGLPWSASFVVNQTWLLAARHPNATYAYIMFNAAPDAIKEGNKLLPWWPSILGASVITGVVASVVLGGRKEGG